MKYIFLSFVGNTYDATRNTLKTLIDNGLGPIEQAILLYTDETAESAYSLKDDPLLLNIPSAECVKAPIDQNSLADVIRQQLKNINTDEYAVVLNSNGGMGYQVALITLTLFSEKVPALIYNEAKDQKVITNVLTCKTRIISSDEMVNSATDVKDILDKQKIEYTKVERKNPLHRISRQYGIKLPKNRLENISINSLTFDMIWNDGNNRLNYLIFFNSEEFYTGNNFNSGYALQQVRDYSSFVVNKNSNNHNADKTCYGIFCYPTHEDRFINDSQMHGKSLGCFCMRKKSGAEKEVAMKLKAVLSANQKNETPAAPAKRISVQSDTLVFIYSQDKVVLDVIESSKDRFRKIIIMYTEGNELYSKNAHELLRIIKDRPDYPEVELFPVDLFASVIFDNLYTEKGSTNVAVNVTPGTKIQTSHLSLWAACNHAEVYTINNPASRIECLLNSEKNFPCKSADPFMMPHLFLNTKGGDKKLRDDELPFFELFYSLLSEWSKKDREWPFDNMGKPDRELIEKYSQGKYYISCSNKGRYTIKNTADDTSVCFPSMENHDSNCYKMGSLYEFFVSFALLKAGASYVHTQVRLLHSDAVQAKEEMRISKKAEQCGGYDEKPFRADIDVLAAWRNHYLIIECKAQPYGSIKYSNTQYTTEEVAHKINTSTSILDRFTIPFVAYTNKKESEICTDEKIDNKKVFIFGWTDLCCAQRVEEIITNAAASKQTTRRRI